MFFLADSRMKSTVKSIVLISNNFSSAFLYLFLFLRLYYFTSSTFYAIIDEQPRVYRDTSYSFSLYSSCYYCSLYFPIFIRYLEREKESERTVTRMRNKLRSILFFSRFITIHRSNSGEGKINTFPCGGRRCAV